MSASANGDWEWRVAQLETTTTRHDKDLYYGNGLPGLTTRMKTSEDRMSSFEKEMQEWRSQRDTKQNLILAGVIALLGGLLLAHLKII